MRDNLGFQTITQTTERSLMSEELLSFFPINDDRIFDESKIERTLFKSRLAP